MAGQPTHEQQVALLKQKVEFFEEQLKVLKAQQELDQARHVQDAQAAKTLLDAQKSMLDSDYAAASARSQLPFAELQGIKSGLNGLTMPQGKEGTISIDGGKPGTLFLVSRRPQLGLLNEIADSLAAACQTSGICPEETVVLTEAKLGQSMVASFTYSWICHSSTRLCKAANPAAESMPAKEKDGGPGMNPQSVGMPVAEGINAAAYGIGMTMETLNSLLKLLRTDREMLIFDTDAEAFQMLDYLLSMRRFVSTTNPALREDEMREQADSLLRDLEALRTAIAAGKRALDTAGESRYRFTDAQTDDLKAAIDEATLLLDSLHPCKKPEAFWAQVEGQVTTKQLSEKSRLIVELKAQVVQEKTSNWFLGERVNSSAEMLLFYRLVDQANTQRKADIILHGSKESDLRYDEVMRMSAYLQNNTEPAHGHH